MSEQNNHPQEEAPELSTVTSAAAHVSESTNTEAQPAAQSAAKPPRVRRERAGRPARRVPRSAPVEMLESSHVAAAAPAATASVAEAENLFAQVLSGEYDHIDVATPTDEENSSTDDEILTLPEYNEDETSPATNPETERRILAPDADVPKLQKALAQAGVGSRRDLEKMIMEGRITVNGETAHIGQRIGQHDRIQIDGKPVHIRVTPSRCRVLAYHKPVGEVVTYSDPQQRPTVFRRLPFLAHGKWQSVGRLDLNTEGLLLFTNFGELANRLMHPRFGLEREYAVRVLGRLSEEMRQQLLAGVDIEGQKAAFSQITDGGGEGVNHWYRVVIHEGRNREVRKLFDAVGLIVSRLIRIRYGNVVLPRGLKRSGWVDLSADDIAHLFQMTGLANSTRGVRPSRGNRRAEGLAVPSNKQHPKSRSRQPSRNEPREFIPNPLQQTYDQRAFKEDQRRPKRHLNEEGPIPNPLIQNFDKRAVQVNKKSRRPFSDNSRIPDPLQQTYDRRAHTAAPSYFDEADDFDHDRHEGPIPNPLQQTFDRRFNGRSHGAKPQGAGGGHGFNGQGGKRTQGGSGREIGQPSGRGRSRDGQRQPDPMQTAVGFVGADAVLGNKGKSNRRPRRR